MAERIIQKIIELKNLEQKIEPRINDLNEKREKELQQINKKYDQRISEVSNEVENFKRQLNQEIYESFEKAIMDEFDQKRSTSEYSVTSQIKEYRDSMKDIELFPNELIKRLDKIIAGEEPIENLAYDLEDIKTQHF